MCYIPVMRRRCDQLKSWPTTGNHTSYHGFPTWHPSPLLPSPHRKLTHGPEIKVVLWFAPWPWTPGVSMGRKHSVPESRDVIGGHERSWWSCLMAWGMQMSRAVQWGSANKIVKLIGGWSCKTWRWTGGLSYRRVVGCKISLLALIEELVRDRQRRPI